MRSEACPMFRITIKVAKRIPVGKIELIILQRFMKKLKLAIALTALALISIIVLQNSEQIETKILFATITMPRAILLGVTFVIGIIVGLLIALIVSEKRKKNT